MPFTQEDCIKEVILKAMVSLAWQDGKLSPMERQIIVTWVNILKIEGPEKERLSALLETSIDEPQRQVFLSELRALLIFETNRRIIYQLLSRGSNHRVARSELEKQLRQTIKKTMRKRSNMEILISKQENEIRHLLGRKMPV